MFFFFSLSIIKINFDIFNPWLKSILFYLEFRLRLHISIVKNLMMTWVGVVRWKIFHSEHGIFPSRNTNTFTKPSLSCTLPVMLLNTRKYWNTLLLDDKFSEYITKRNNRDWRAKTVIGLIDGQVGCKHSQGQSKEWKLLLACLLLVLCNYILFLLNNDNNNLVQCRLIQC